MALEAIFAVTIGLGLTWVVLSLAINQINDWISISQLRKPERDLREAIGYMVQDPDLLNKFYAHPVIRDLTPRKNKQALEISARFNKYPIVRGFTKTKDLFPSVISREDFANAMFYTLIYDSLTSEEMKEELSLARMKTSIERLQLRKPHLSEILRGLFPGLDRPTILDLKIAECKSEIQKWYNRRTAYLVESQRRYEEAMALLIGFLIALLLNIDMIHMTTYLWREPTIRQILVQNASNFTLSEFDLAANPLQTIYDFNQQFIGLQPPIGWVINVSNVSSISDRYCQLFPGTNQAFGIPLIGSNKCIAPFQSTNQTNIVLKLIGISITALAGRLGAPLWANIFKRLVSRVQ